MVSIPSTGDASASSTAAAPSAATTGGASRLRPALPEAALPPAARRASRRKRPEKLKRRERECARCPSTAISAGSSVVAPSTATATTSIAPSAIERIAVLSSIHSPASEMITVRPENSTATPEVAIATARASSGERPAWTSSR